MINIIKYTINNEVYIEVENKITNKDLLNKINSKKYKIHKKVIALVNDDDIVDIIRDYYINLNNSNNNNNEINEFRLKPLIAMHLVNGVVHQQRFKSVNNFLNMAKNIDINDLFSLYKNNMDSKMFEYCEWRFIF